MKKREFKIDKIKKPKEGSAYYTHLGKPAINNGNQNAGSNKKDVAVIRIYKKMQIN